jgi:hypothetical protein
MPFRLNFSKKPPSTRIIESVTLVSRFGFFIMCNCFCLVGNIMSSWFYTPTFSFSVSCVMCSQWFTKDSAGAILGGWRGHVTSLLPSLYQQSQEQERGWDSSKWMWEPRFLPSLAFKPWQEEIVYSPGSRICNHDSKSSALKSSTLVGMHSASNKCPSNAWMIKWTSE